MSNFDIEVFLPEPLFDSEIGTPFLILGTDGMIYTSFIDDTQWKHHDSITAPILCEDVNALEDMQTCVLRKFDTLVSYANAYHLYPLTSALPDNMSENAMQRVELHVYSNGKFMGTQKPKVIIKNKKKYFTFDDMEGKPITHWSFYLPSYMLED